MGECWQPYFEYMLKMAHRNKTRKGQIHRSKCLGGAHQEQYFQHITSRGRIVTFFTGVGWGGGHLHMAYWKVEKHSWFWNSEVLVVRCSAHHGYAWHRQLWQLSIAFEHCHMKPLVGFFRMDSFFRIDCCHAKLWIILLCRRPFLSEADRTRCMTNRQGSCAITYAKGVHICSFVYQYTVNTTQYLARWLLCPVSPHIGRVFSSSDMSKLRQQIIQKLEDKAREPAYPLYKATQSKILGYFQIFLCGLCSLVTGAVACYYVGPYKQKTERDGCLILQDGPGVNDGVIFGPFVSIHKFGDIH